MEPCQITHQFAHPISAPSGALLMTDNQVATCLQISRRSVWERTRRGELPSLHVGGARRWRRQDVESFIDRQAVAASRLADRPDSQHHQIAPGLAQ